MVILIKGQELTILADGIFVGLQKGSELSSITFGPESIDSFACWEKNCIASKE